MSYPKQPSPSPSTKPFIYGDRVKDPTDQPLGGYPSRTVSVSLLESDLQLLKSLTATRGNIQLTCASLVHSFCSTLRSLGITDYTRERDFHLALAVWSALDDGRSCTFDSGSALHNLRSFDGGDGSRLEPLLSLLPHPAAELIRSALCRGATPQASGVEPGTNVTRGTKSVRNPSSRAKKKSSTPPGKGA